MWSGGPRASPFTISSRVAARRTSRTTASWREGPARPWSWGGHRQGHARAGRPDGRLGQRPRRSIARRAGPPCRSARAVGHARLGRRDRARPRPDLRPDHRVRRIRAGSRRPAQAASAPARDRAPPVRDRPGRGRDRGRRRGAARVRDARTPPAPTRSRADVHLPAARRDRDRGRRAGHLEARRLSAFRRTSDRSPHPTRLTDLPPREPRGPGRRRPRLRPAHAPRPSRPRRCDEPRVHLLRAARPGARRSGSPAGSRARWRGRSPAGRGSTTRRTPRCRPR